MNWKTFELKNLSRVFQDGDWIESKDQSPSGIRLIQTGNVGVGIFRDKSEKARFISADTFTRLNCNEIFPNDCLVSRLPDPVGRACMLPNIGSRMITAVDCTILRFDEKLIIPKFFIYYSQSSDYLFDVDKSTTGTTRKRISKNNLSKIKIPLPSLPEQQRILEILDQSFAAIDQAIENIEKNIISLNDLNKSYLTSILKNIRGDFIQNKLKEITSKIGSGATPLGGKNSYKKTGTSLIRSLNVYDDGFQYKNLAFINEKQAQKLSSVEIEKRDILLNITGASILRCCVVPDDVLPARVNQHVMILRSKQEIILPEFLQMLLTSNEYKTRLLQIAKAGGSTREALTKDSISNFIITFPKQLPEQSYLVNLYKSFVDQNQNAKNNYNEKILKLHELKQSILHKAFQGEL